VAASCRACDASPPRSPESDPGESRLGSIVKRRRSPHATHAIPLFSHTVSTDLLSFPGRALLPRRRPPSSLHQHSATRGPIHFPNPSMASTYALPLNPPSHSHSHGQLRSQYLSDRRPSVTGNANLTSPMKANNSVNHTGHTHTPLEMGKQLVSPYAADHEHDHGHDHTHNYSKSDSTYALKSIVGSRPRTRPRGESDLGRPVSRKSSKVAGYGFSPIQEGPAPVLPAPSTYVYSFMVLSGGLG
jgi:hypothetical protein